MNERSILRSYSGPHFPAFGLNTERYGVTYEVEIHSVISGGMCFDFQKPAKKITWKKSERLKNLVS